MANTRTDTLLQGETLMKYVLFDLDGTITDPKSGITKSVAYALKQFGIDVTDLDSLCSFIGPPLKDSFRDFYNFSEEDSDKAVDEYRVYYRDKGVFDCIVYEGIKELLEYLHESGMKVILATSKPDCFASSILEHFGIMKYFDIIAGSELKGPRVEKEDVIEYAISQIPDFKAEEAVMIGDRKFDYIGASKFGIPCILVGYGYGEMEELKNCNPFAIKNTVEELTEFFKSKII